MSVASLNPPADQFTGTQMNVWNTKKEYDKYSSRPYCTTECHYTLGVLLLYLFFNTHHTHVPLTLRQTGFPVGF